MHPDMLSHARQQLPTLGTASTALSIAPLTSVSDCDEKLAQTAATGGGEGGPGSMYAFTADPGEGFTAAPSPFR